MAEKDSSLLKQMKTLKDTQDDIQGMSTWCLSKGLSIAPKIISTWSRAFKEAEKGSHRVSLFYLANDIVQHAKRRKIKEFVEGWNKVLVFAMPLVRTDPEVCRKVKRVLNIWKEREIYEANFIRSLEDIIDQKSESEPIDFEESVKTYRFSEFATQCAKVVSSSERTERAKKAFEATKLNFSKVLEMREKFKEYKPGDPRITEFYASVSALREYCSSLKSEREDKLRMIRIAEIGNYFYSRTRREAKVVTKAYKNFENRLKDIHEKVMECEGTLPSPVPSPEPNAPSPVDSEPEEVPVKSVIASKFGGNGMLSSVVSVVQKEPYSSRRSSTESRKSGRRRSRSRSGDRKSTGSSDRKSHRHNRSRSRDKKRSSSRDHSRSEKSSRSREKKAKRRNSKSPTVLKDKESSRSGSEKPKSSSSSSSVSDGSKRGEGIKSVVSVVAAMPTVVDEHQQQQQPIVSNFYSNYAAVPEVTRKSDTYPDPVIFTSPPPPIPPKYPTANGDSWNFDTPPPAWNFPPPNVPPVLSRATEDVETNHWKDESSGKLWSNGKTGWDSQLSIQEEPPTWFDETIPLPEENGDPSDLLLPGFGAMDPGDDDDAAAAAVDHENGDDIYADLEFSSAPDQTTFNAGNLISLTASSSSSSCSPSMTRDRHSKAMSSSSSFLMLPVVGGGDAGVGKFSVPPPGLPPVFSALPPPPPPPTPRFDAVRNNPQHWQQSYWQ